jgi:hypothetical protein
LNPCATRNYKTLKLKTSKIGLQLIWASRIGALDRTRVAIDRTVIDPVLLRAVAGAFDPLLGRSSAGALDRKKKKKKKKKKIYLFMFSIFFSLRQPSLCTSERSQAECDRAPRDRTHILQRSIARPGTSTQQH